ncbi:MAG: OsmC family protein [Nitriliruptorales bacterium]|nr:OsmC family protein [Nitriliruptorales bacterium]
MASIKESIDGVIGYLADNPEKARYTDSLATATLGDALRVTVDGDATVVTDMPKSVGGEAEHASPGWLLRAAVASCVATLIGMEAARDEVELSELVVEVDSFSDDHGILRMADDVPVGPMSMSVRVHIAGDADDRRLEEIARRGAAHCPVCDAIKRAVPVEVDVDVAVPGDG